MQYLVCLVEKNSIATNHNDVINSKAMVGGLDIDGNKCKGSLWSFHLIFSTCFYYFSPFLVLHTDRIIFYFE